MVHARQQLTLDSLQLQDHVNIFSVAGIVLDYTRNGYGLILSIELSKGEL